MSCGVHDGVRKWAGFLCRPSTLRTCALHTNAYLVALSSFDSRFEFGAHGTSSDLEWMGHLTRQRRGISFRFRIGNVENEHDWAFGLQNDDRTGTSLDSPRILPQPPTGRCDEGRARHLDVNKHRIVWSVEPKLSNKQKQLPISSSRLILPGQSKELVESFLGLLHFGRTRGAGRRL
jgi:hypothetical protein